MIRSTGLQSARHNQIERGDLLLAALDAGAKVPAAGEALAPSASPAQFPAAGLSAGPVLRRYEDDGAGKRRGTAALSCEVAA
jgi:hypothetical protein